MEDAARKRVKDLIDWAGEELDLLSTSFKGCTDAQLHQIRNALALPALPAAYEQFLLCMGQGGVGSAMYDIFPGDDVSFESIVPADDWTGTRAQAEALIAANGWDVRLDGRIVIRMHRSFEVEYIDTDPADPPVWGFGQDGEGPHELHPNFTEWLEWRIGRAIKRRYPLRDAHYLG